MSEMGDGQPIYLRDTITGAQVVLDGAALPDRGVEVGSRLRQVTTWYPGGSSAAVQILGTEEEPIRLEGRWVDTLMGASDAAAAMVSDVRAMYIAQHVVELTWGSLLSLRCHITRFVPRYEDQSRIGWTLELQPCEVDDPAMLVPVSYPETPETAVAWWDVVDEVADALILAAAMAATAKAVI